MSERHKNALTRARANIVSVLMTEKSMRRGLQRDVVLFDLALEHAEAWAADQPPKSDERGGSSSPREASDRREDSTVRRRAALAATRIPENALAIGRLMDELYADVVFLTSITEDDPDEETGELPGCKSCARMGVRSEVYEKSKARGLCRWCSEHALPGQLPPLELVRLHHDGTKSEVSKWLAKHMPVVKREEAPPCGSVFTHLGRDHTCYREQGHSGECAGVGEKGERVTWRLDVPPVRDNERAGRAVNAPAPATT